MERWRKAQAQLLGGQPALALDGYQVLIRRYPKLATLWFELGNAAAGALDFPLANKAYRRAREFAGSNASLLGMIGQQYQNLRQLNDARACYERAMKVDPELVDARINLAVWFEKERRFDEAWECIRECLAKFPNDDQARYFEAFLLHRRNDHEEAERKLRDLIKDGPRYPYVKYSARHLLGAVLDRMGQHAEAMKCLLEAKELVRTITDTSLLEKAYDETQGSRREQLDALTPAMIRSWREAAAVGEGKYRHAFLGGHPRSGTTLVEQILDAHPGLLALDESVAVSQEILSDPALVPGEGETAAAALDRLAPEVRADMRRRYVKSLLREVSGSSSAKVLLDKNPSPTASLNVMLRVIPELKVIIALRDPRDVVISCFFLNIMLNATNVNFLGMERTVKHYKDLMDAWLRLRDVGGFDWIESRYEDVVKNTEAEGRRLTGFLGLEWRDEQMRFFETARRKVVFAPTYHDVTQPVYAKAVGRWEAYAGALEPHQEALAPYLEAFGYA
ncbi:tetratricopeptide repeat-containing sulfotransferase family protein [Luteolibacter marinus]|uniref:tetratricopeptide repeat-containing sulfotransferase family protein n=1 Tax=Luteolibacter marinus TaxID=2776705 RepID=UPI001866955D|nr:sulfotransferase [Luteolibacter marinus]